jgi:hypothetical protein
MEPWLATLIVGVFAAIVLLGVHRHNAFRAASTKYRSTFLETLRQVYPHPVQWPANIDHFLRGVFPTLQAAVAEFRAFVPWYRRRSYDAAWFAYRCSTGREVDLQCYHHYMGFGGDPDPKKMFKSNVDRLLSYARPL